MLNLQEIESTIEKLENGQTSFDNCLKLASLYICRDNIKNRSITQSEAQNTILKEYNDILPQYRLYCEVKRRYQLNELTEEAVERAMLDVCNEIKEFIESLISNSDMESERKLVKSMIKEIGF
jgi:hypothetical protein